MQIFTKTFEQTLFVENLKLKDLPHLDEVNTVTLERYAYLDIWNKVLIQVSLKYLFYSSHFGTQSFSINSIVNIPEDSLRLSQMVSDFDLSDIDALIIYVLNKRISKIKRYKNK